MSGKLTLVFAVLLAGGACTAGGRAAGEAPGQKEVVRGAERLEKAVVLELELRSASRERGAEGGLWPSLSLRCEMRSFSAEVAAWLGTAEQSETSVSFSGTLDVVDSERILVSFKVMVERKEKQTRAGAKHSVVGNAVLPVGKPVVIFRSGDSLLLLTATVPDSEP